MRIDIGILITVFLAVLLASIVDRKYIKQTGTTTTVVATSEVVPAETVDDDMSVEGFIARKYGG